jgi:putative restriction endonuclease
MRVPYATREPFVANTDSAWFEFLGARAKSERVDEVDFWQPQATKPMRRMEAGEPVFFRLEKPTYAIAGYGFQAHFMPVGLHTAWSTFTWKSGDPNPLRLFERIGKNRGLDLRDPRAERAPIGCTVLGDATFWPRKRWMPWGEAEGCASNIVQCKTERDQAHAALLMQANQADARTVPDDLVESFVLFDVDHRELVLREVTEREGQGAFRLRLPTAYEGRCAITTEHTQPVLGAAHIQPWLGPRSNHVQNGILLTKELHTLFDPDYVGITPDDEVRISERLRTDWNDGMRYYQYAHRELRVPNEKALQPSRDALAWHDENVFKKAG